MIWPLKYNNGSLIKTVSLTAFIVNRYKFCLLSVKTNVNDLRALLGLGRKKGRILSNGLSNSERVLKLKACPYKACTHVKRKKNATWLNKVKNILSPNFKCRTSYWSIRTNSSGIKPKFQGTKKKMIEGSATMQSRKQMKASTIQSWTFSALRTRICRLTCNRLINGPSMRPDLGPTTRRKRGRKLQSYEDRNKSCKQRSKRHQRLEWTVQN